MIQVKTADGQIVHLTDEEVKRIQMMGGKHATYADTTHQLMLTAQNELREATGDYPEDWDELFEFAVKHALFGDREDTHIMCNFFKVFYCLLQKNTHELA